MGLRRGRSGSDARRVSERVADVAADHGQTGDSSTSDDEWGRALSRKDRLADKGRTTERQAHASSRGQSIEEVTPPAAAAVRFVRQADLFPQRRPED